MAFNISDAYYTGQLGTYGTARGTIVSDTVHDTAYLTWLANERLASGYTWPSDPLGAQTGDALDALLVSYGQPTSGLGSVAALGVQVVTAANNAATFLINQVYPNPVVTAARTLAATVVTVAVGAPGGGSPDYTWFNSYSVSEGYGTSVDFAAIVQAFKTALGVVGSAFNTLEATVAAATAATQLTNALATFQLTINQAVVAVNAANPNVPLVPPAAITIKGVNA